MLWNVYKNGKWIDGVFFDDNLDKDYVLDSLINHDGYEPGITVQRDQPKGKGRGQVIDRYSWT